MKRSMHINESIPVTITHVKENRKNYYCCPTKSERKRLEINILTEKTLVQNS